MRQPNGSPLDSLINVQVSRRGLTANIALAMQASCVILSFLHD